METLVSKRSKVAASKSLGSLKELVKSGDLQFSAKHHQKENDWVLPKNTNGTPFVVCIIKGVSGAKTAYLGGDVKNAIYLKELVNEQLVEMINSDGEINYMIGQSSAGVADVSDLF